MKEISIHEAKLDYIKNVYKDVIESLTSELEDLNNGSHYACDEKHSDIDYVFEKAYNIFNSELNIDNEDTDHNAACLRCNERAYQEASGIPPEKCSGLLMMTKENRSKPFYYNIKK